MADRGERSTPTDDALDRFSTHDPVHTRTMGSGQERSIGLTGGLAISASSIAVILVVVAVATDRPPLLGGAALAAVAAVALVAVRRRAGTLPPPTSPDTAPSHVDRVLGDTTALDEPTHDRADAADPAGDQAGDPTDDAAAARAELLATLRHGFHPDADQPTEVADSSDTDATPAPADTQRGPIVDPEEIHESTPDNDRSVLRDPLTGLFTQDFFEASLPKAVSSARRGLRPLSVAAVTVVVGHPVDGAAVADPAAVARTMVDVFREADTVAMADDGLFLVLLEDTPEAGAVWTLERLRRDLTSQDPSRTMWAGVSCYPAYSFDADGLITQARAALHAARQWQQDRIEIAPHTAI